MTEIWYFEGFQGAIILFRADVFRNFFGYRIENSWSKF